MYQLPKQQSSYSNYAQRSYPYGTGSSSPSHAQSMASNSHIQDSSVMSKMDERSAFSLLQHLGKDELSHLLENDSKLQDLINDLPQVKGVQEDHDNLVASNKSIAEYNLSLQPRLEELKQFVASGYDRQNALKNTLAVDKAELDSFVNHQSLDTLLALLQTETAKAEEESEDLTSEFYDSSLDMEEFVNQFLSKRTCMHLRRIRSERMAELIRDGPMGGTTHTAPHSHHPPNNPPYPGMGSGPSGAPYPMGGSFSMPQPRYPY